MVTLTRNTKVFLNYFIGPLLFIWLSFSIYHQVKNQSNLHDAVTGFRNLLLTKESWKLWAVFVLMITNWGVEARKLQILLHAVEVISWQKAFRATLTGVAFALNTPNRIGDYGGKLLYVQQGNRAKALSLLVMGNISQFIVTLSAGFGGLIFLLYAADSATTLWRTRSYFVWMHISLYIVGALLLAGLLVYFRFGYVTALVRRIPGLARTAVHTVAMDQMEPAKLAGILGISFIRYLIFAAQYILLLQLTQVGVTAWQAFWLICVVFLVLSIVPTIAFAEIGLRGQIGLELFGLYSSNQFGIIAASVGIWCINLVIPAIAGSLLVLNLKTYRNK